MEITSIDSESSNLNFLSSWIQIKYALIIEKDNLINLSEIIPIYQIFSRRSFLLFLKEIKFRRTQKYLNRIDDDSYYWRGDQNLP